MDIFRKDSNGNICFWRAYIDDSFTGEGKLSNVITIEHGRLNGTTITEHINITRDADKELKSRYDAKFKQGYKAVTDVKDNSQSPVKESLYEYLREYLPDERTTADGVYLHMLAKTYDNTNNKVFKLCLNYLGQWKINGLRCFVRAHRTNDFFNTVYFTFQSREGIFWNSLLYLNEYFKYIFDKEFIDKMIDEGWILDGELYIPGLPINEINSAVKNTSNYFNKHIQFWCYDIYIPDTTQYNRYRVLYKYLGNYTKHFINKDAHINNTERFILLPTVEVSNQNEAVALRDAFIDRGFEGLIMRNPNIEYSFGKRHMIKFKKSTDGKFKIIDIVPEGLKRPDIAKFICKNDINEEVFECKLSAPIDYQKECLKHKEKYIGKILDIEYGERTGVAQVPFHIKLVKFV